VKSKGGEAREEKKSESQLCCTGEMSREKKECQQKRRWVGNYR